MNVVASKVRLIESAAPNSLLVNATLDKLIGMIADDYRHKLAEYRRTLSEFERQHGMTTAEFQRGFDSGELGDAPEWFDWDGYAALSAEAQIKLTELERGGA
jgi:hypothetical protein